MSINITDVPGSPLGFMDMAYKLHFVSLPVCPCYKHQSGDQALCIAPNGKRKQVKNVTDENIPS